MANGEAEDWVGRLPVVLDTMAEGLQVLGFDWRYLYLNQAAAAHGRRDREELLGKTMQEAYPGIERSPMWKELDRCMRERVHHRMDNEFTFPDGSARRFELRIAPIPEGLAVLSIDIEDRHQLEMQLVQSQKMEAVGQLAGGIAHDFNNLLTIVATYAEFVSAGLPDGSDLLEDVAQIRSAAARGAKLTRQLLALGRRQVVQPVVVSVNDALTQLQAMLGRLMGDDVDVRLALAEAAGRVRVDPGHLDQVLMNLAVNARDAMPKGGQLTLRTANVTLDQAYADTHPGVLPGDYVMVAVTDTGHGMDAETLQRIFEPFFTTKGPGRGTGLGLATTHGIVRQNGGHIWVYSEPNHGTTFKLYFPRVTGATEPSRPSVVAPTELRGRETVMVVDDEAALRSLCARALAEYGYTVLEASRGQEALLFSERYSGTIDALVTDVIMPDIGGPELAARLQADRPGLCVLFMSGYADNAMLVELPEAQYLEKPFTPEALARQLRLALAAAQGQITP